MLPTDLLAHKFAQALNYNDYVKTGNPDQQSKWKQVHDAVSLTPAQTTLLQSFSRDMHVLVTSGIWCGDCSAQCPILARISDANPKRIRLRFLDRDQHADLSNQIKINDGLRVPTAIFAAEDFHFLHLFGDRTLSRYRAVAQRKLGAACPLPGAPLPPEELAATTQDWVNEFERIHLLLRLSARLRELHGD